MHLRFRGTFYRYFCCLIVALGWFAQASLATAAPAQLYNKSVNFAWTISSANRSPDGKTIAAQINVTRTVYVSSAGRLFIRGTAAIGGGSGQMGRKKEIAPGGGSTGTLAFQGNQLVGTVPFQGAAQRIVVSFDSGFTSCTAAVMIGKLPGTPKWQRFDGAMYEIVSATVGTASCSVREGNALAD